MKSYKRSLFWKCKSVLLTAALASVVVAVGQVGADEVKKPSQTANDLAQTSSDTAKQTPSSKLADETVKEIQAKATTPVVPADKAQPGDVVKVATTSTELKVDTKENETGTEAVAKAEASVNVETTTLAAKGTPVGEKAPVVTTKTASDHIETDEYVADVTQTVKKTRIEKVLKEADVTITKQLSGTADIVFAIDKSVSMDSSIQNVMQNIENFVRDLASKKVDARLGLIAYESAKDVQYFDFNGSKFTKNVEEYIKALKSIRTGGGIEEPTAPLHHIATSKDYDWSTASNNRRFAFLITDEGIDFSTPGIPTVDETIKALKAANISLSVVGMKYKEATFKPLVEGTKGLYLDMSQEFSSLLNRDFTNHVVKTVQEGRVYRVVNEKYDFLAEAHVVLKPKAPVQNPVEVKPVGNTTPVYHTETVSKKAELPKTGTQASSGLAAAGLVLLAAVSGLTVVTKKEEK